MKFENDIIWSDTKILGRVMDIISHVNREYKRGSIDWDVKEDIREALADFNLTEFVIVSEHVMGGFIAYPVQSLEYIWNLVAEDLKEN